MKHSSILVAVLAAAAAVALGQSSGTESAGSALSGNPAAGKAIFDGAGNCLSCHRAGAQGSVVGPNLSNIGAQSSPQELRQDLVNPPGKVAVPDRLYEVVTRDGKTVRGKLLNQDPFSVQMLDANGQLVAFSRSEIKDAQFVNPPQMPSYQGKLSDTQLNDLVAYLASLRVPDSQ